MLETRQVLARVTSVISKNMSENVADSLRVDGSSIRGQETEVAKTEVQRKIQWRRAGERARERELARSRGRASKGERERERERGERGERREGERERERDEEQ